MKLTCINDKKLDIIRTYVRIVSMMLLESMHSGWKCKEGLK